MKMNKEKTKRGKEQMTYRVSNKKVFHESEEKMHKKMKMTLQRAENLVQVQEHYGISFYEKIFFLM